METGKIQHLEPHIKEENRSFRVGRKMLYSLTWERPLREMKTEVANQTLHQMPDTSAVLAGAGGGAGELVVVFPLPRKRFWRL